MLAVRGLQVTYPSRTSDDERVVAVRDFDLTLKKGERVAVVGESGSGKTTACMALAGFIPGANVSIEAERFRLDGVDVEIAPRSRTRVSQRRPGVSVVFQDAMSSLDPVWTVGSQFRAALRAQGVSRKSAQVAQAREWLHRVGLPDSQRVMAARPYELSGGMRQRTMLALAMAGSPRLLIADEPTSALDATLAREMMALIADLVTETGTALLMVSHDIALTQEFCERTLVMYGGSVVEEGTSAAIREAPRHSYTSALLSSVPSKAHVNAARLPTIPPAPVPLPDIATSGCPFRHRCPRSTKSCAVMPEVVSVSGAEAHLVRCWHPSAEAA